MMCLKAHLLLAGAGRENSVEGVLALLVLPDVVQRQLVRDIERHLPSPNFGSQALHVVKCFELLYQSSHGLSLCSGEVN